jgi:hypothetical protein
LFCDRTATASERAWAKTAFLPRRRYTKIEPSGQPAHAWMDSRQCCNAALRCAGSTTAVSSFAAKRALPVSNICSPSCLGQAGAGDLGPWFPRASKRPTSATTSGAAQTSKDHRDHRLQLPLRATLRGHGSVHPSATTGIQASGPQFVLWTSPANRSAKPRATSSKPGSRFVGGIFTPR